jgi:thioester reductase-like protein
MDALELYRSKLIDATATIERLRNRLGDARQHATEPIAVVGMGLRMPGGAETPEAFWTVLRDGVDTTREFPQARADANAVYDPDPDHPGTAYVVRGGFLDAVDGFDPAVFGISPREAVGMDPQQRIMLELTWEALERAGYSPTGLTGSRTGVYFGVSTTDYVRMRQQVGDIADVDAYQLTGEPSFIAGRVSYSFGLRGPSSVIDTTCSSSLVAVHEASHALRGRECDMAVAGGVNLMLSPYGFVLMSKFRALAADGRCKTFDAAADGYARGEGAGVLILKRLSDAVADGDTVLAVVRGSAVNHDGRSSGLTVPNPQAQQDVIQRALDQGGVPPDQVDYVEAHGTGTSLGDPIELRALDAVLRKGRDTPLLVGSVKTNIGHLEPAAGIAGLIKVILSLQHAEIPPHLHLVTPNPKIPWSRLVLEVPTSLRRWPGTRSPRTAGVSSFGASGTNAHIVLSSPTEAVGQPKAVEPAEAASCDDGRSELLLLSARTPTALRALAGRYADYVAGSRHRLADLCFTSQVGRARLAHGAAVAGNRAEIADRLAQYARGAGQGQVIEAEQAPYQARKLAFLFTGQGAQYRGMAEGLREDPVFAAAFAECDELISPLLPRPLAEVLWGDEPAAGADLDDTRYTQPALFAVEYALGRTLLAAGVRPAALLGHSVGEITAACLAGVIELPDAARLVAHRGRLMSALPAGGAMTAVGCDEETARAAIDAAAGSRVSVAAVNGPEDVVLSGAADQVEKVVARLSAAGHRGRPLNVSHAFHSALLDPMIEEFKQLLATITFKQPEIPLVSNLTGGYWTPEELSPDYWVRHASGTVRYLDGLRTLYDDGIRTYVEVGPHPVLTGMGRRALDDPGCGWTVPLRKGQDDRTSFLEALGALHLRGCPVDWAALHDGRRPRRVPGPTYPWERERFWFRTALPGANGGSGSADRPLPGVGSRVRSPMPVFEELLPEGTDAPDAADALGGLVERAVRAAAAGHGGRWRALSEVRAEPSLLHEATGPWLIQSSVRPGTATEMVVDVSGISPEASRAEAGWLPHGTATVHRTPSALGQGDGPPQPDEPGAELALTVDVPDTGADEAAAWGTLVRAAVQAVNPAFESAGGPAGWVRSLAGASCRAPALVTRVRVSRTGEDGTADVTLHAADGELLGGIKALAWEPVPAPPAARWYPEGEVLRTLEWTPAPPRPTGAVGAQRVLLVGGDPLTGRIQRVLDGRGVPTSRFEPGVDEAGTLDALLAEGPTRVVVSGLALSTPEISADLLADELFATEQLIVDLVKRMAKSARTPDAAKLVLLTSGAVRTGPAQRTHHPLPSTLWGLGRVIALEHPDLWGALLDLDPDTVTDTDTAADTAADAVLDLTADEDQYAFRGTGRLVARLRPTPPESLPAPASARPHRPGTVLVTGGLGGIGLAVAEWLARTGTERLVLAARTPLPPESSWQDPALPAGTRARIEAVERLRDLGAEVEPAVLDVTDADAVAELIGRLAGGPLPLRGVIHAAGVSGPQDLADVGAAAYRKVWAPKTIGSWLLHEHTRDLDLDLFVGFSSIAATWGSQHLASYAAGNSFLDALAVHRRGLGLPALSVAWGPWGQHSHLFENDVMEFLESVGLRQLAPAQCLSLLARMLRAEPAQQVVCAADWDRYKSIMESRSERPVFAELKASEDTAGGGNRDLLDRLASHDARTEDGLAARHALLADFLRTAVADVLATGTGVVTADTDLFALGLDSLMVMEIMTRCRRDLGIALRPKDLFARSALADWTQHLEAVLRGAATETVGGRPEEAQDEPAGDPEADPYDLPAAIAPRARLAEDIRPPRRFEVTGPPQRVLLTGATGFVGAYLLDELLGSTDAEIECLVRCVDADDGLRRIRQTVETYLPWRQEAERRVKVLPGDLAAPELGLGAAGFAALADRVDAIHHSGAWVDFVHTFDQLAGANIGGTEQLLRLTGTGRPKHLNHVSTYGIWGLPLPGRSRIREDEDIDTAGRLVTGYVQTKWGAEHLVRQAIERGMPVRNFRLGRVLGDSRSGACLTTHFTCRVIKGCIQLGLAPDLDDLEVEMTPVDYVARAMTRLSAGDTPSGVYHLINPHRMPFLDLVRYIGERGWPVKVIDRQEWWAALRRSYDGGGNALHPVMDIVREFVVGGEDAIDYDVTGTTKELDGTGIDCPPLDDRLLETYFDYFIKSGYLAPATAPRPRRATK